MKIKDKYNITDKKYYNCVKDLIETNVVKQMDDYIQHGTTTCLKHCIDVSYKSYKIAKKMKLDYIAVARAGLLHDLFLYDCQDYDNKPKFHIWSHPKVAFNNASQLFVLNKKEKDIILKHMWPLTLPFPHYKESFIVTFVDKYCATLEIIKSLKKKFNKF